MTAYRESLLQVQVHAPAIINVPLQLADWDKDFVHSKSSIFHQFVASASIRAHQLTEPGLKSGKMGEMGEMGGNGGNGES